LRQWSSGGSTWSSNWMGWNTVQTYVRSHLQRAASEYD
jgi:hypothetical protein